MFQSTQENDQTFAIGLDASITSFGVYCMPINHNDWYGFSLSTDTKDGSDATRVKLLANEIMDTLSGLPHKPSVFVFEDYGPIGRTSGKITARAELCGILKYHALRTLSIPIIMVTPTALKSFATGNHLAKKEQMLNRAHQFGFYANNHDEADAYFAAKLGFELNEGNKVGVAYTRVNP